MTIPDEKAVLGKHGLFLFFLRVKNMSLNGRGLAERLIILEQTNSLFA